MKKDAEEATNVAFFWNLYQLYSVTKQKFHEIILF